MTQVAFWMQTNVLVSSSRNSFIKFLYRRGMETMSGEKLEVREFFLVACNDWKITDTFDKEMGVWMHGFKQQEEKCYLLHLIEKQSHICRYPALGQSTHLIILANIFFIKHVAASNRAFPKKDSTFSFILRLSTDRNPQCHMPQASPWISSMSWSFMLVRDNLPS